MTDPDAPIGRDLGPVEQPAAWNAIASGYDEVWFDGFSVLTDRAIELVSPGRSMAILDVGAGPGTFSIPVAARVARVVAIDFAHEMIARLRSRLNRDAITNVETHVMDGQALSFPDISFDAVVSMFGWFLFPDRTRGLTEFRRVVRDGGRVLVTSWAAPDRNLVLGAGLTALREALPDLPRPTGPLPTQLPEACSAEMRDAGFTDVTTSNVGADFRYTSAAAYWDRMVRSGAPLAILRAKLGEVAWQAASARAVAALRSRHGDGELTLRAEAIFTMGVR